MSTENKKKFRILAIDGGGIKGLIPLQFLKKIEEITGEEIHKSFDLIAGTSTGGILASALTLCDEKSLLADKRKLTISEIEDIYKKRGKEIFATRNFFTRRLHKAKNWFKPHYNPSNLNKILVETFSNTKIGSCLKPIFITSYDLNRNKPIIFTYRDASLSSDKNSGIVEVCRATSAAPTYFPSYTFTHDREVLTCIDGGIYMNNPSLGALIEVLGNSDYKFYKLNGKHLQLTDITILSLGTGTPIKNLAKTQSQKWGKLAWIKPVIDLATNAPVEVIHTQLNTIFKSFGIENQYLRIDIPIDVNHKEMSDASVHNIDYLISTATSEIKNNTTLIGQLKLHLQISGTLSKTRNP